MSHRPSSLTVDLSIVVPTYNPQERIFSRVLTAIGSLLARDPHAECLIVDNRSDPPVIDQPYVQAFLQAHPSARVAREQQAGLTFARLTGIRATTAGAIVMFDDDNVPSPEYLETARACLNDYPWVGVWGAGNIDVEFLDPVPAWLQPRARLNHNQRSTSHVKYGCVPASWQEFYPIGMGLVVRRDVAERYRHAVESGVLTATDRQGRLMSSGGDTQIVWEALKMGLAAGVHPQMQVMHLIPGHRATVKYMKRVAFGCGVSYLPALMQSFPEQQRARHTGAPGGRFKRLVKPTTWSARLRHLPVEVGNAMGLMCGRLRVAGHNEQHWMFRLARRFGLT